MRNLLMLSLLSTLLVRGATYVTTAEIETALKQAPPSGAVFDKVIKTVDAGGYKVSIVILRRIPQAGKEDSALSHEKVTEVYEILTGSGTLETGGQLTKTSPVDLTEQAAGPSTRGVLEGGEARHMGPGDIAVITPGVPHRFKKLEGTITYLVTRIELTSH
jgi:mannose-6-phosphate isomerase-like protein (cupin superfamily)